MKAEILIAILGYGCSAAALLADIGTPQRFWRPMYMWNDNVFLFEVFWFVLLYFTVTTIELSPLIFERFRAQRVATSSIALLFSLFWLGLSCHASTILR